MSGIIENARTIEEKRKSYVAGQKVDYSFLKEWRDVRTLLSDKYFDEMLREMTLSKGKFAFSLQPGGGSKALKSKDEEWFTVFNDMRVLWLQ